MLQDTFQHITGTLPLLATPSCFCASTGTRFQKLYLSRVYRVSFQKVRSKRSKWMRFFKSLRFLEVHANTFSKLDVFVCLHTDTFSQCSYGSVLKNFRFRNFCSRKHENGGKEKETRCMRAVCLVLGVQNFGLDVSTFRFIQITSLYKYNESIKENGHNLKKKNRNTFPCLIGPVFGMRGVLSHSRVMQRVFWNNSIVTPNIASLANALLARRAIFPPQ